MRIRESRARQTIHPRILLRKHAGRAVIAAEHERGSCEFATLRYSIRTMLRARGCLLVVFFGLGVAYGCTSEASAVPPGDAGADAVTLVDARIDVPDVGPKHRLSPFEGGGPTSELTIIDLPLADPHVDVPFDVPEGALGFHVLVQSLGSSIAGLSIESIRDPMGTLVHENNGPVGASHPTSDSQTGMVASAQVPQGGVFAGIALPKGKWVVRFGGGSPVRAKIQIQTTPDGKFHGGLLNVNVFVPEGLVMDRKEVTAQSALTHAGVIKRLEGFFDLVYDLYGLRNGTLRFFDIPAKYVTIENAELDDVFAETRVLPAGQSVSLFLSEPSDNGDWWGVAGGIPGSANTTGTDQSGFALASQVDATVEESFVLAHELGHFMGLNHTSEMDGRWTDPLPDTPECPDMFKLKTNCPDYDNIMFALGKHAKPITTSTMQRRVVQGSPMFQAFIAGAPPPASVLRRESFRSLDFGRMFGKPGAQLDDAELRVVGASCKHPSHVVPPLTSADRANVARIADDPRVSKVMRGVARRLLRTP